MISEYAAPYGAKKFVLVLVSTKMSRLWRWASALENLLAMKAQEIPVRLG